MKTPLTHNTNTSQSLLYWGGWSFMIVYFMIYGWYVMQYALNVPYLDDYNAILGYLIKVQDISWIEQVKEMFVPHNEHIMWGTRLIGLLQYHLIGSVDFQWLILLGNVLFLVQFILLYRLFPQQKATFWLLGIILLNPQYSATSFWAMAVWSNVLVIVLATLTISCLVQKKALWWGIVLGILTLFSNGNGMMILPIGFLILWWQGRTRKDIFYWILASLIGGLSYFMILRAHPTHDTFFVGNLLLFPLNMAAFMGAYAALTTGLAGQMSAIGVGVVILVLTVRTAFRLHQKRQTADLTLLSIMLFVILTACSVAIFRSEKGMDIIIGSRYKHYSSLAIALAVLMACREEASKRVPLFVKVIGCGILLSMTTLFYIKDIGYRLSTRWILNAAYHNILYQSTDLYSEGKDSPMVKAAQEAHKRGIFIVAADNDLHRQLQKAQVIIADSLSKIEYQAPQKFYEQSGRYLSVTHPQLSIPTKASDGLYLVLDYGKQTFMIPTSSKRNSLAMAWRQKTYFQKGVEAETIDRLLPKTKFGISWLEIKDNSVRRLMP
ncbi:hypothetical protein P1X15_02550 [Runella sp. MFBS21]|uniref:hypothetical protein n=1 Tax=Runella sp. MFBS21 TaxID=3034018 RepID=UPI0023F7F562|nr:hypothetical protein [Runella sp. MFBS21]MDF7816450.1 hypothetical protein [Runella sp. MFBS21]